MPWDGRSNLTHCQLQGISTDESTLFSFLEKITELSHLSTENIELSSLFNHLTSQPQLSYLFFNDLYENRHIGFDAPGKPHYPYNSGSGPNDLTRAGAACRREIKYQEIKGWAMSVDRLKWSRRENLLYGPPDVNVGMSAWWNFQICVEGISTGISGFKNEIFF